MNPNAYTPGPDRPPDWHRLRQFHCNDTTGKCAHCGQFMRQHISGNYWCPPTLGGEK